MSATLRWRAPDGLDAGDIDAWTGLAARAGPHPNPFAMPQFVLPAARWLTPSKPPRIAWIERGGPHSPTLIAVGAFAFARPDLFVPLPHLCDYRTPHTFRGGLLVAAGEEGAAIRALLSSAPNGRRWRALDVRNLPLDCAELESARHLAGSEGGGWFPRRVFERPILDVPAGDTPVLPESKDRRRHRRRLQQQGALEFRLLRGAEVDGPAIRAHLALEHAGWKGGRGSSLLSAPAQAAFFREMIAGFAGIGAAVLMETRLDGRVIASSSNLLLGDTLNGFKIGWDPEFAACGPGILDEAALIAALPAQLPGVRRFDSQAQQDSYLARLLPQRMRMATGTLALDRNAARAMRAARWLRPLAWRLERDG